MFPSSQTIYLIPSFEIILETLLLARSLARPSVSDGAVLGSNHGNRVFLNSFVGTTLTDDEPELTFELTHLIKSVSVSLPR